MVDSFAKEGVGFFLFLALPDFFFHLDETSSKVPQRPLSSGRALPCCFEDKLQARWKRHGNLGNDLII